MNFNENITITDKEALALIKQVDSTPLHICELPLHEHPDFPLHNRFMRVLGIDFKTFNEFLLIQYAQIGLNKETGDALVLPLECPDFVIYKSDWSYLRKADGSFFTGKNESGEDEKVKVPTVKYMLWLSEQGMPITKLLATYLPDFQKAAGEKLNEKKNILY